MATVMRKPAIVMDDLIVAGTASRRLFDRRSREQSERRISALDATNAKFGRGRIAPAAAGIHKERQTEFDIRSSRYTTGGGCRGSVHVDHAHRLKSASACKNRDPKALSVIGLPKR